MIFYLNSISLIDIAESKMIAFRFEIIDFKLCTI